jgi:hypothetical protein
VRENANTITIEAELPGVDEKDVSVTVANGMVTIKGEKKQQKEEKTENYYLAERSYGVSNAPCASPTLLMTPRSRPNSTRRAQGDGDEEA